MSWGCATSRGDKVLFANPCDFHGFKLGFAILLQILSHFASYSFSAPVAILLWAKLQYRKHPECNGKAVIPILNF